MKIYVNSKGEIQDVGTTEDSTLTKLIIDDENNPFEGWSEAKICCYKVLVENGAVVMMTPYVSTSLIKHIEQLGHQNKILESRANDVDTTIEDLMTNVIPELLGLTE